MYVEDCDVQLRGVHAGILVTHLRFDGAPRQRLIETAIEKRVDRVRAIEQGVEREKFGLPLLRRVVVVVDQIALAHSRSAAVRSPYSTSPEDGSMRDAQKKARPIPRVSRRSCARRTGSTLRASLVSAPGSQARARGNLYRFLRSKRSGRSRTHHGAGRWAGVRTLNSAYEGPTGRLASRTGPQHCWAGHRKRKLDEL